MRYSFASEQLHRMRHDGELFIPKGKGWSRPCSSVGVPARRARVGESTEKARGQRCGYRDLPELAVFLGGEMLT